MTSYSEVYSRLLKEDLEARTSRAEARRNAYRFARDEILKPIAHYTWEGAKLIGRGIKATAKGVGKAGVYAADVYTNSKRMDELESKLTGADAAASRETSYQAEKNAEREMKIAQEAYKQTEANLKQAFKSRKSTIKQNFKNSATMTQAQYDAQIAAAKTAYESAKAAAKAVPGGLNDKKTVYGNAKAKSGGFWRRYVLDPVARAETYKYYRAISDNAREKGVDITPLQIYALFRGYKDKFKEYGKPGKSPMFEVSLHNPFTGQPFKQKVKKKDAAGVEQEVEEDVKAKIETWDDLKKYMDYASFCINTEEMRRNPINNFFSNMRNMGNMDPFQMWMYSQMMRNQAGANPNPAGAAAAGTTG